MEKRSIVDFKLESMSMDYKREFFYKLDMMLKEIHTSGGYVMDFSPKSIYVSDITRIPAFTSISSFQNTYINPDDVKRANLLMMADLAFCCYLPEYSLDNGLLNPEVLATGFDNFKSYFPEEDVEYYKSIFELDYADDNAPILYYSDYINQKKSSSSNEQKNSKTYIKSTPAGKAMSHSSDEAAFASNILMMCIVGIISILSVFGILQFVRYFF
ncbi:MAG: hypothetical protein E7168_00540 [Firmicutes bacterium]|nr:hypothetical protein [Bacillota bacterium]